MHKNISTEINSHWFGIHGSIKQLGVIYFLLWEVRAEEKKVLEKQEGFPHSVSDKDWRIQEGRRELKVARSKTWMLIDLLVRFSWPPKVKELSNQNIDCGL